VIFRQGRRRRDDSRAQYEANQDRHDVLGNGFSQTLARVEPIGHDKRPFCY
jgi:hypothetical protein